MVLTKTEYDLINETKCGDEPLSILLPETKDPKALDALARVLVRLVKLGYLECSSDDKAKIFPLRITLGDLRVYFRTRTQFGEKLQDYPGCCPEYHFRATDKGIKQLRLGDRPIPLKDVKWINGRAFQKSK